MGIRDVCRPVPWRRHSTRPPVPRRFYRSTPENPMDLSEISNVRRPASAPNVERLDAGALLGQLGSEVAGSLSQALERVVALTASGRIDKGSLRALREEIESARRAAMVAQQVTRFASGRVQMASERLDLTGLLRDCLRQRARETEARGVEVRQLFAPVQVMGDSTLSFSLLQALMDWSVEHALARIDLRLDVKTWPAHARLTCSFAHRAPDETSPAEVLAEDQMLSLNTMAWHLLQQIACTLGLVLERKDTPSRSLLCIEFPDTVAAQLPGMSADELDDPHNPSQHPSHNSQPLAGLHVLVLSARRDVRNQVRETLRPMGLTVDFVASVEEAGSFCRDALPHAVVYESVLAGERFERLRTELLNALPSLAFVQIAEDGRAFEVLNVNDRQFASVGRGAIGQSLPAAMLFEMSRGA